MWPHIRQTLLHSIQTIQLFHKSHGRLGRNLGIAALSAGIIAGAIVHLLIMYSTSGLDNASPDSVLAYSLYSGITPGTLIALLASSLLAVHFHNGSLPANGQAFVQGIPGAAWQILLIGSLAILIISGFRQSVEWTQLDSSLNPDLPMLQRQAYNWLADIARIAEQAAVPLFAVMVYLRGIGQRYSHEYRGAYIAIVVAQFFWILLLQTLISLINQLITTPLGLLFSGGISSEIVLYIMMGSVAVFVYLFGMIPAAALTSSIVPPEAEIEFEGETEKRL